MRTIFVSSTFRDMHAERDAIRDIVAPEINNKAVLHGDRVDFCDLRWGINTLDLDNDAGSQKVLDICFREIDKSSTPMIILLGNRYGWIPNSNIVSRTLLTQGMQLADLERSVTALEIEYGTILKQKNALVYYRNLIGDNVPDILLSEDSVSSNKLSELKSRLEKLTNCEISTYDVHVIDGQIQNEDINNFAHQLVTDLERYFKKDWEAYDEYSPFDRIIINQWTFVDHKSRFFAARQYDFEKCMSYIQDSNESIMVCKGDVGSGKSTLLSRIALECRSMKMNVLPLISGHTEGNNDALSILKNEIQYVESILEVPHLEIVPDLNNAAEKHVNILQRRLCFLSEELKRCNKTVLILIDAIDQLQPDSNRDELVFFPSNVSDSIRFFVTCTSDFEIPYTITHVLLPLKEQDKRRVIDGICSHSGKELSEDVISAILRSDQACLPIYLSLIVIRLLLMNEKDYSIINNSSDNANTAISRQQIKILSECSEDTETLSVELMNEVGKRINSRFLVEVNELIACSRYGLRTEDLSSICSENWNQLDFYRFINYLDEFYIIRDDGRYDFFHKCFKTGFLKYVDACHRRIEINRRISDYFDKLDEKDSLRKSELMYHIISSNDIHRFASYIKRYVLSKDEEYVYNAATACQEISLIDRGEWLIEALKQPECRADNIRMLWFISNHVYDRKRFISKHLEFLIPLLKETEKTFLSCKEDMSSSNQNIIGEKIYDSLSLLTYLNGDFEDSYDYSEKLLDISKGSLDWKNPNDKLTLYKAYYIAIVRMKRNMDEQALQHTLNLGQECLDMMDDETWNLHFSSPEAYGYPLIDCLAEIYGSLGNRAKCLQMYEKGMKQRELVYNKHPSPETRSSLAGSYFNIAQTEQSQSNYSRAYTYITKAVDIFDSLGDIIQYYQQKKKNYAHIAGGEHFVFVARVYELASVIAFKYKSDDNAPDDINHRLLEWMHKALGILVFTYSVTNLSTVQQCYELNKINFSSVVQFSDSAEYKTYKKAHKKWLDLLLNKVLEDPTAHNYRELYSLVTVIAHSIRNSSFPDHLETALELLNSYQLWNSESSLSDSEELSKRIWNQQCSKTAMSILVSLNKTTSKFRISIPISISNETIIRLKRSLHYQNLKIVDATSPSVINAISSYAVDIEPNKVIAIDEFSKKSFFQRGCKGIVFAKEHIASSLFPEEYRTIRYGDIISVSQYVDDIRIKLTDGKHISIPLNDMTKNLAEVLSFVIHRK